MVAADTESPFVLRQEPIPDLYTDSTGFEANVYGFTILLGQAMAPPPGYEGQPPSRLLARIHMSPQHAKVMAHLFSKSIREYEEKTGTISLPEDLRTSLGLQDK